MSASAKTLGAQADAGTTSRELTVPAEDGYQLAATLFEPATTPMVAKSETVISR